MAALASNSYANESSTVENPQSNALAPHHKRKFILCFDGTGNKFQGDASDSNILKIYRMLDRSDHTQFHYYQPGIGTYVTSGSVSHTSTFARFHSWYVKSKDSMFGTSLAEHVLAGYTFLMRYYRVGDEIYLFGFSRGAYTARFLAEMIDHVGLLSQGNEELIRFAWKTFQKWQTRSENTDKDKKKKKKLLKFMMAFRETFARPVKPIRFLGLFDTVNSVPRFENALMSRKKFRYTARSSARVIRHAVSIDERRAKFRQDLIGERREKDALSYRAPLKEEENSIRLQEDKNQANPQKSERGRPTLQVPSAKYRDASESVGIRSRSPNFSIRSEMHGSEADSNIAFIADEEEEGKQDIQEVWFSGCHADIGGGWPLESGEEVPLSHIPLVWMVRESQRAGLVFDDKKARALHCSPDPRDANPFNTKKQGVPKIVEPTDEIVPTKGNSLANTKGFEKDIEKVHEMHAEKSVEQSFEDDVKIEDLPLFYQKLHLAQTKGRMHDVLCLNNGVRPGAVAAWNFMEYLPLRRMDLQDDGSWKPIRWPLPKGETRDISDTVVVHNSVIKRMRVDATYRSGNLICGGGGRGIRKAPPEFGIGKWKVLREEGDWIGECYVRAEKTIEAKHNSAGGLKKLLAKREKSSPTTASL